MTRSADGEALIGETLIGGGGSLIGDTQIGGSADRGNVDWGVIRRPLIGIMGRVDGRELIG